MLSMCALDAFKRISKDVRFDKQSERVTFSLFVKCADMSNLSAQGIDWNAIPIKGNSCINKE
ncbi:hypothetical protein AO724_12530 [Aeromonas allosaccharophila]|nr:hypothetical protein AO724_12530 [Aeromonas allosaccharophila]